MKANVVQYFDHCMDKTVEIFFKNTFYLCSAEYMGWEQHEEK